MQWHVYLCTVPRPTSLHSRSLHHTSTTWECSGRFYTRTGNTWSSPGPRWERLPHSKMLVSGAEALVWHHRKISYCMNGWQAAHHSWPRQSSPRSRPCRRTSTPGSRRPRWNTGRCRRRKLCQTQTVWLQGEDTGETTGTVFVGHLGMKRWGVIYILYMHITFIFILSINIHVKRDFILYFCSFCNHSKKKTSLFMSI